MGTVRPDGNQLLGRRWTPCRMVASYLVDVKRCLENMLGTVLVLEPRWRAHSSPFLGSTSAPTTTISISTSSALQLQASRPLLWGYKVQSVTMTLSTSLSPFWRSLLIATSPSSTEVLILRARQWKTALKPGGFCRLFHYPWVGLCTCGHPPFLLILFFNHVLFLFSLFYILPQSHLYEPPFLACCVLPVSIFHLLQHLKTEV